MTTRHHADTAITQRNAPKKLTGALALFATAQPQRQKIVFAFN
jgi:hypothetical protein